MKATLVLLPTSIIFYSSTSILNRNNTEQLNLVEVNNFDSLLKSDTLKYRRYSLRL